MTTTYKMLKLDEITVDQSLQVRKALDEPTVERYATLIGEGAHFPPLTCGWVKGEGPIYLIDGFHRHAAYSRLSQLSGRAQDCFVKTYDSYDAMFEDALKCNMLHGLTLTEEERRDAILKVIQRHPEESQRQLADRCGCARSTIQKYQNQVAERGHLERPAKVKGKDGKEYPTTVARKAEKPAIVLPPEPTEEDFEEPADDKTPADAASVTPAEGAEVQKPNSPAHFCAGGCGTPIWDDMKKASDCTYVEQGGRWFCSEECAKAYVENNVESEPDPEPEKEAPAAPAVLHVPQCPFNKFHRPKLQKVSNNGYRVKCPECEKEGRRVGTFVEKSWKKAYQSWGRYDIKTKTLEELLEESDY